MAVDGLRNVVENVYFGLYFGARYGVFPDVFGIVLGNPLLLILPKLANVVAGCVVLGLMFGRWLPAAIRERLESDQTMDDLRHYAAVDGMTGLFNKSHFDSLAAAEWARSRRHNRPLSLIMIDIDLFKSINDRHGHDVGDRLIIQVANACRDQKRGSDIVARLGGEEFALLLPETELASAAIVAERLRDSISRHVLAVLDDNIAVTASMGISEARGEHSLREFLKHADMALYDAKRNGRNRVCSYDAADTFREGYARGEGASNSLGSVR